LQLVNNHSQSHLSTKHLMQAPDSNHQPISPHLQPQLSLTVTAEAQLLGTVKDRLRSLSQVTVPELATLIYLYVKVGPAARVTAQDQSGFAEVYWNTERA